MKNEELSPLFLQEVLGRQKKVVPKFTQVIQGCV